MDKFITISGIVAAVLFGGMVLTGAIDDAPNGAGNPVSEAVSRGIETFKEIKNGSNPSAIDAAFDDVEKTIADFN